MFAGAVRKKVVLSGKEFFSVEWSNSAAVNLRIILKN